MIALDPNKIKLTATYAQAVNPDGAIKIFNPSAVASDNTTINIGGHGFADGQAVTYHAPAPQTFTSGQVNVNAGITDGNANPTSNPANKNIFFFTDDGTPIDPGWATTTKVVYHVASSDADPARTIGGLVDGGLYRVVRIGGFTIQLKYNDVVTSSVDFVRSASGDQIIRHDGGNWTNNGFNAGQDLIISSSPLNNATYNIASVSADGSTLTLVEANTDRDADHCIAHVLLDRRRLRHELHGDALLHHRPERLARPPVLPG